MLAYTEQGQGHPVVLLHGFPLNRSIWECQVSALSPSYRVIALDLPGHGESPLIAGSTIQAMAQEVLHLLDHLKVGRFAVAGHSMGGYVALALQSLAPDRVVGLGLIGTQAGADSPEARQNRYSLSDRVGAEGASAVAAVMAPKLFASGVQGDSPIYQQVVAMMEKGSVPGIQGALSAMAERPDMQSRLPAIECRTLVLTGDDDRAIPAERSEVMAANLKHAVLVRVEGAGHMPMLERPSEVNQALSDWLRLVY